jgi:aspartokinase
MAPISDCSARNTALSGRFSTKLRAVAQSTWPLAITETAGVCPSRTNSVSMRAPSLQKFLAIFLSMGEITSAALVSTRNRSCGSDAGSATAILTVSTTNFCSRVSLLTLAAPGCGLAEFFTPLC